MTQLENYISQPYLTDSIYVIFRDILFNFHEYLSMGVIDVYFIGNVAKVPCWRDATNYVWTSCPSICSLLPTSTRLLSFVDFLLIGCAIALPMGVAPEAIAKSFRYRLKKIGKPAPFISSRIICRLYSPLQWISPLFMSQAPELKTRWTCASWQIFSYSLLSSLFLYASFSLIR
jgi:hypothetical protein